MKKIGLTTTVPVDRVKGSVLLTRFRTPTHIVDPKHPGAVDEIIHLGDYWYVDKMEENKEEILESIERNGKFYKRAYKY